MSPDECKFNIQSPFSSVLIDDNAGNWSKTINVLYNQSYELKDVKTLNRATDFHL